MTPLSNDAVDRLTEMGFSKIHSMEPQEHPKVYERFKQMAEKAGIDKAELYVGTHAVPALLGIQTTEGMPIIVTDKLFATLSDDEVIGLLGNMMARYKHRDKGDMNTPDYEPSGFFLEAGFGLGAGWALNHAVHWIEGGKTLKDVAQEMSSDEPISRRQAMSNLRYFLPPAIGALLGAGDSGLSQSNYRNQVKQQNERSMAKEGYALAGDTQSYVAALKKLESESADRGDRASNAKYNEMITAQERGNQASR